MLYDYKFCVKFRLCKLKDYSLSQNANFPIIFQSARLSACKLVCLIFVHFVYFSVLLICQLLWSSLYWLCISLYTDCVSLCILIVYLSVYWMCISLYTECVSLLILNVYLSVYWLYLCISLYTECVSLCILKVYLSVYWLCISLYTDVYLSIHVT